MAVEDDTRGSAPPIARLSRPSRGDVGLPRTRGAWGTAAAMTLVALALFALYFAKARTIPLNADGPSNALQAWDMLNGNLLLRGWAVSDVSFYTTELPEYALIELVHGLNPGVIHIAAGLTYTLLVLATALLAKGRAVGREALLRAAIAAGIMLAPTWSHPLSSPDHTGTMVPLLAVWLLVDRAPRRWWVPVAVGVLLAWTQVADAITIIEGALPLAAVCVARVYWQRVFPPRGSIGRESVHGWDSLVRGSWFELSLAAAAILSVGAAEEVLGIIRRIGGFTVLAPPSTFNSVDMVASHAGTTLESLLVVFSADFSGGHVGSSIVPLLHLPALALASWAFWRATRRFLSQDLVVQGLVVSIVFLLLAYTFVLSPTVLGGAHEIVGVLPMSAVLAGRLLGPSLVRAKLLPALAIVLVCCIGSLMHQAVQPPPSTDEAIGSWLHAHGLTYGLSDYWDANNITLATGQQVRVRSLSKDSGSVVRRPWESKDTWYTAASGDARFFVIPTNYPSCPHPLDTFRSWIQSIRNTFGAPAKTYRVDGFEVMIYTHNMLARRIPLVSQGWPGSC